MDKNIFYPYCLISLEGFLWDCVGIFRFSSRACKKTEKNNREFEVSTSYG